MGKNKYLFVLNKSKYFPQKLDINLLVCTWECGRADVGTSKFKHICDSCGKEYKTLYNVKYELVKKSKRKRYTYDELPYVVGNTSEENWIDDITYEEFVSGNVDCIGNIDEIYIALAVCTKECGHTQLIYDGASQVCPKCGKSMFRVKVEKYRMIK